MKSSGLDLSLCLEGSLSLLHGVLSSLSDGGDGFLSIVTSHKAAAGSVTPTSPLLNLGSPFIDADLQCVGAWPGYARCHAVVETGSL